MDVLVLKRPDLRLGRGEDEVGAVVGRACKCVEREQRAPGRVERAILLIDEHPHPFKLIIQKILQMKARVGEMIEVVIGINDVSQGLTVCPGSGVAIELRQLRAKR